MESSTRPPLVAVIDGHNDAFTRLEQAGAPDEGFFDGHHSAVTAPAAEAGGLVAGLCAVTVPAGDLEVRQTDRGYEVPLSPAVDRLTAAQVVDTTARRLLRTVAKSGGRLRLVEGTPDLEACMGGAAMGVVLHMEGAEPLAPGSDDLERWYARGLRSLGPVWSRPNAFGSGVPFRFPASPDIGPGLTRAGIALVRRCRSLGIAVDVSHLNAAGFGDVARVLDGPIIASHSGVHALCPSTRNLTDDQLSLIAASDGLAGVSFEVSALRADGRDEPDTPLTLIVEHIRHIADSVGVKHVALGSDFDGATMPSSLRGPDRLQHLLGAMRDSGFDAQEIECIANGNWRRVLAASWN